MRVQGPPGQRTHFHYTPGMFESKRILNSGSSEDPGAAEELLPLIYSELRRLASSKMAGQRPGQTIQATALVHEAFLKLSSGKDRQWKDERHFFAAAAEVMRQILIDRARRRLAAKHGGGVVPIPLDGIDLPIETETDHDTLMAVNEALTELERLEPEKAQVVKLRYFVGLQNDEIAELLGVSTKTVQRYWIAARAWLFRQLDDS